MATTETKTFEAGVAELEAIVQQLESGELSLEEALGAFERGVGLVRTLHAALNQAEQRVEVLSRDGAGEMRLEPLPRDKGPQ